MDGIAPSLRSPDIKTQSSFWPHSHPVMIVNKTRNHPPITEELLRELIADYLARFEGPELVIVAMHVVENKETIQFIINHEGQVSIAGLVLADDLIFPLAGGIKLTAEGAWQIVELHHDMKLIPRKKK